jgi:hypothetical protein
MISRQAWFLLVLSSSLTTIYACIDPSSYLIPGPIRPLVSTKDYKVHYRADMFEQRMQQAQRAQRHFQRIGRERRPA